MRALRISLTAPTRATSTAPSKKYFSTSSLSNQPMSGRRLKNLGQSRLPGSHTNFVHESTDKTKPSLLARLRDTDVEHRSNKAERLVDIDCESVHSDHGGEGHQGDDQRVFH